MQIKPITILACAFVALASAGFAVGPKVQSGQPSASVNAIRAGQDCAGLKGALAREFGTVVDARNVPASGLAKRWCQVTVEVAHPLASHVTTIWIRLPVEGWNGRFLGVGGGNFTAGTLGSLLYAPEGFAVGSTDAGHHFAPDEPEGAFALDANGRLDWSAIRNLGYRGVHEMTVTGKAVAAAYYGARPHHAYFVGCSSGGRQGQEEVQRYPGDYNGVISGGPAVSWAHFLAAVMWPHVVMHELQPVASCKFEAARKAVIAVCDAADGLKDGLVGAPQLCHFDSRRLIGTVTPCGTIDARDAEVIRRIWDGPRRRDGTRLWTGIPLGASFDLEAATEGDPPQSKPNDFITQWFRYFLLQNPRWDPDKLDGATFEELFDQSVEQYGQVYNTGNPDLSAFAAAGGKTILWHGMMDQDVSTGGTVDYVDAIRHKLGAARTNEFLRLYLAPNVAHCGGGDGPQPVLKLDTLIDWVEKGKAPGALLSELRDTSGVVKRSRPLCPYPQVARYKGRGSIDVASSFECRAAGPKRPIKH